MKDRLNVLFLSSWYPCRSDLYNGNFVARHAVAVSKYANVYVIHACSEKNISTAKIKIAQEEGVQTIRIYYPKIKNNIPVISQIYKYLKVKRLYLNALLKLKKEIGNIDIIHANILFPIGLVAKYLSKKFTVPFVITEHWTGYLPANKKKISWLVLKQSKNIALKAAFILPVSVNLRNSMQKLGINGNYQVLANVVNTNLFSIKKNTRKPIKFIHVSTLNNEHKNISGILRTIKALSNKRSDFQVLIVGDGDTKPHINYAKKLNIPDKIIQIKGAQPIEKIAALMQQSDVFLLFSNYENLPCVISEALCTGLPVISSDVGGVNEMINPTNGILVDAKDEAALCHVVSYMIDNQYKYKASDIRKKAVEKYSYHKVGQKFINIYHKILKP